MQEKGHLHIPEAFRYVVKPLINISIEHSNTICAIACLLVCSLNSLFVTCIWLVLMVQSCF
jgi:hypothetical protein